MFTTATLPLTTAGGTANGTTGAAAAAAGAAPFAGLSPAATAAGRPGMSFEAWLAGAVAATADGEPLPVEAGNGLPPIGEGLPVTAAPGPETGADGETRDDPDIDELAALLAAAGPEPAPESAPVVPPGVALLGAATSAPPPAQQTVSLTPPPGSGMTGRLLGVRAAPPAIPPADPAAATQGQTAALPPAAAAAKATAEPAADADFASVARALESAAVDAPASETGAPVARENPARQYQHLAGAPASAAVPVPVGKPGWSEAVVDKVMWFSAQQLSSAEIQLNPPELGPLQVRVSTHQDQTSVYFSSHHAAVRDALDQTLPRLREMMDNQGIQLLDVGVGEHGSARQQAFRDDADGRAGAGPQAEGGETAAETAAVTARAPVAAGLVDAYA